MVSCLLSLKEILQEEMRELSQDEIVDAFAVLRESNKLNDIQGQGICLSILEWSKDVSRGDCFNFLAQADRDTLHSFLLLLEDTQEQ